MTNPHDKFFKEIFSRKETAVDFPANTLPPEILRLLDLDSMEITKDSFIDEELKESFSDLLYQVKLAGVLGYIYILWEHKSFPDRFTTFQLLKYMVRIWELHLKQSTKPDLPVILPLVLYQGVGPWNVGNRFRDLLDGAHETLFSYAPDFEVLIHDLSRYSDEEIKGGVMARVTLLAMKYALRDELPEKIAGMMDLLTSLADREKGLKCLELLFRYLVQATEKLSKQDFERALLRAPEGGAIMSTLAEQWFQEGMDKGRQEGRLSESWEVTLELFEAQFGVPSQSVVKKLHDIQSYEILRMLRRQLKNCETAADFEHLVEKALQ